MRKFTIILFGRIKVREEAVISCARCAFNSISACIPLLHSYSSVRVTAFKPTALALRVSEEGVAKSRGLLEK